MRELVEALSRRPEIRLGLITGNDRACAFHKLHHAGLPGRFLIGGFGHEHPERDVLAGLAVDRMVATLGPGEEIARAFLLGDTPRDARAAKVIGATAIGVATGPYSVADLLANGCDHAVESLANTEMLLGLIAPGEHAELHGMSEAHEKLEAAETQIKPDKVADADEVMKKLRSEHPV